MTDFTGETTFRRSPVGQVLATPDLVSSDNFFYEMWRLKQVVPANNVRKNYGSILFFRTEDNFMDERFSPEEWEMCTL
jgi:hypothetical protein